MPAPAEWLKFAPPPRPLTGADKYHVFLSYRSVNRPWVLNLYDTLRELGYEVFLDQVRLKPGDRLIKELQAGLQASQSGVLVWSKKTADSEIIRDSASGGLSDGLSITMRREPSGSAHRPGRRPSRSRRSRARRPGGAARARARR